MASYGWTPDLPDHRDHVYALPKGVPRRLPDQVDLRRRMPPAYRQGDLNSCTANAIAAVVQCIHRYQGEEDFMPSRLGIYYLERKLEHSIGYDCGAMLRDGIKVVKNFGVWPEAMQPYIPSRFRRRPSQACLAFGLEHQAIHYERIDHRDLKLIKGRLASGLPFVFGFTVFSGFDSPQVKRTGILHMPADSEKCEGGHAVVAVGYSDARKALLVRNSFGPEWGRSGHFWMPYAYATHPDLADDFWAITALE